MLTASTRQQVLSRADARGRLGASKPVFEVSHISELSGSHTLDGRASVAGVDHFERCGTRWRYDLAEGLVPEVTHQIMPLPQEGGERRPPGTRARVQILPQRTLPRDARVGLDRDTGRLVRFCSGSDRLLSPILTEMVPVGHSPSKPAWR